MKGKCFLVRLDMGYTGKKNRLLKTGFFWVLNNVSRLEKTIKMVLVPYSARARGFSVQIKLKNYQKLERKTIM